MLNGVENEKQEIIRGSQNIEEEEIDPSPYGGEEDEDDGELEDLDNEMAEKLK